MNSIDTAVCAAANAIRNNQNFLLVGHVNPDGDTISSQLALYLILKKLAKNVDILSKDPMPDMYKFLPAADNFKVFDKVLPKKDIEVILVLDIGDPKRIGYTLPVYSKELINIDHHTSAVMFGTINCIDETACATAELVYRLAIKLGVALDYDIALNLYVGIFTDTGSFRFNNTNKETFLIAADLVRYGVIPHFVAEKIFYSIPPSRLRLLTRCLNTLEIREDDSIAAINLCLDDYAAENVPVSYTEDFINFPRSLDKIKVAILFKETEPNIYKISMRSKNTVDVAAIARTFGGGGHKNAAGFQMEGALAEIKEKVYRFVREKTVGRD